MLAIDRGIRSVATGFGQSPYLAYSEKSGGSIVLESEAERMVAHMLNLDPEVVSYTPQPFSVELVTGSIARSCDEKNQLRARVRNHDAVREPMDGLRGTDVCGSEEVLGCV